MKDLREAKCIHQHRIFHLSRLQMHLSRSELMRYNNILTISQKLIKILHRMLI